MHRRTWISAILLAFAAAAGAQTNYPTQPIKLVVPWPPGGGVDTTARIIATPLAQKLGQPIVIDNKPGAGGNIGTEAAARAAPDGYTLLMGSISPNAINVHLYSKLPFDIYKDFTPIIFVSSVPNILVVPAGSPINSVAELVAQAKANPGKLNYASGGVGSSQHLAASIFKAATKIDVVHVPYKGTEQAEADLVGGHVSFMLDTTTCLPFIAAGKMRALAVASKKRNPALPNVPTFDELGIPGVYSSSWYGLMGPAHMPKPVVDKLNADMREILASEDMKKRLVEFGAEIGGGSPEDFSAFIASEIKRYGPVIQESGAKID